MIHEVLEDHDPLRAGENRLRRGQDGPVEGRQGATMHVEAGQRLDRGIAQHEAFGVGHVEHVLERLEPARRHEEGTRDVAGLDRAADDLLALCQEDAALGLEELPHVHVAEIDVVAKSRVSGVGDFYDSGHMASLWP